MKNLKRNLLLMLFAAMVLLYIFPHQLSNCSGKLLEHMMESGTLVLPQFRFSFALLVVVFPIVVNALIFSDMFKGILQKKIGIVSYYLMEKEELLFSNLVSAYLILFLPFFIAMAGTVLTVELPKFFLLEFFAVSFMDVLFFLAGSLFVAVTIKGIIPQLMIAMCIFVLPLFMDLILAPWMERALYRSGIEINPFHALFSQFPIVQLNQNFYRFSSPRFFIHLVVICCCCWASAFIFTKWKDENLKGCVRYSILKPVYETLSLLLMTFISAFAAKSSLCIFLFCLLFSYILLELLFNESMKSKNNVKFYAAYTLALATVFCLGKADFFQRASTPPPIEEVDSIYIGESYNRINSCLEQLDGKIVYDLPTIEKVESSTMDNTCFEDISEIQQKIVSCEKYPQRDTLYIAYKMKNNKRIIHRYDIDLKKSQRFLF